MTAREQAVMAAKARAAAALTARVQAANAMRAGQPTPGAMAPGAPTSIGDRFAALSMPMKLLIGAGAIGAAVIVARKLKK